MTTLELSVIFFLVGIVEWYLETWEKLVSVRLKLWSTILYSSLNQIIDFFMYVFLFSVLIQFWETWHSGVHDYYKLIPYVLYTLGKICGTGVATWLYASNKKKRDREKSLKWLEKGRQKQKKLRAINKDISSTVEVTEVEPLFDTLEAQDLKEAITERVIETTAQQISDKIDAALGNVNEESENANKETNNDQVTS
jgi:hypothetical protein